MPNEREDQEYQQKNTSGDQFSYATGSEASKIAGKKHTDVGLGSLTSGDFFNRDGTPKTVDEIVALLQPHKPGVSREELINQINDFMPKLRGIDKKEASFLAKEKDIKGQERGLAMGKAEDVYGLGVSAVERERGGIEETYQLGARSAQRGLGTALGQAQQQASSLGGQMRGAYGGMGGGMRGAIGGQQTLAKGVESMYGGYADKQTALAGARGRGLGAVEDTLTQLGQQRGYAETQYGAEGIGEQRAELAEEKGLYGLKEERRAEFETDVGEFLGNFKTGGRVPTFSEILSRIPDAGGS